MLATLNAAPEQVAVTGNGYAVAYPFGIIGVLLTMGLLRMIFRVNVPAEAAQYASAIAAKHLPIGRMSIEIARLNRAGIDLASAPLVKLQFGDHITCVGEDRLRQVEAIAGNQTSALQHSQIIPIFVGIALGVLLCSILVFIPGASAPLSLGLASGPMVVAIVLARIGAIGPLRWNMPPDTIDTVRELGVSLFMACIGIYARKSLVATVLNGDGLLWMGCAALSTFIPTCLEPGEIAARSR